VRQCRPDLHVMPMIASFGMHCDSRLRIVMRSAMIE
jgi:hypothetical protein